jgi:predicted glycogen debranching enzyme
MEPAPGKGQVLFAGEVLRVRLTVEGDEVPSQAEAFLRTDINSAPEKRLHTAARIERGASRFAVGWHDVPMERASANTFEVAAIAFQPGYYEFKAHLNTGDSIYWPSGHNAFVSVHPLKWWGGNTIYTAFPRQFGPYKALESARHVNTPGAAEALGREGFAVIPPSGTFADLEKELPFLFHELGVRILHLLPVQETPTNYARMGLYGSPYAAADMRSVNHAYCVFRTDRTPDEHFQEFCAQVHAYGGEVLLDIAVKHLGWSSELLNEHPDWFVRRTDGRFVSPGAWGVVWEDLVELNFGKKEVWRYLADSLLLWCQRGVDGFRADAGYQVPVEVWEYVTAKVHQVFPDTLFLLEGLGGSWEATESILRRGGMQWAYSEMFQQQGTEMLHGYLRHLDRCFLEVGILANYAETHDNTRLALGGEKYAKLRLALCALTSSAGAFGFTNGVEWLATEKVDVHGSSGLRWGHPQNLVPWIRTLNGLLKQHPVFRGSARILPVEGTPADALGFVRKKADEAVLVVMNLHGSELRQGIRLPGEHRGDGGPHRCLLTGREVDLSSSFALGPMEMVCLDLRRKEGLAHAAETAAAVCRAEEEIRLRSILGEMWGERFALTGFEQLHEAIGKRGLKALLAAAALGVPRDADELAARVSQVDEADIFLGVSKWTSAHGDRLHVFATDQFLYLEEEVPFRVRLAFDGRGTDLHTFQDFGGGRYVAFARVPEGDFTVKLNRLDRPAQVGHGEPQWMTFSGPAKCLKPEPQRVSLRFSRHEVRPSHRFLLTNDRGSYVLQPLSPHTVYSKYDALLAANLHPAAPDERVVLLKRARVYLVTPMVTYLLEQDYLTEFRRWPCPSWIYEFCLQEGLVRILEQIQLGKSANAGRLLLSWDGPSLSGHSLLVRPDVELRGHHGETKAYGLNEAEFARQYERLDPGKSIGFRRRLNADLDFVMEANCGEFRFEGEWTYNIGHPHESTRGQEDWGDAFSPGHFRVPLDVPRSSMRIEFGVWPAGKARKSPSYLRESEGGEPAQVNHILQRAARQFLVKRGALETVLAGYPWFLDWARDAFVAARGYLAEGYIEDVRDLVFAFAALERGGTLPNALTAAGDANRDTSDAPLWLLKVLEELAEVGGWEALAGQAQEKDLDLAGAVGSICAGYLLGTPNGIRCDETTGFVYSPPHFTWMDTNHPAATPREGYPVEIQALWVRALEFAAKILGREHYSEIASRARESFIRHFWLPEQGYFADCLPARSGTPAPAAGIDDSLRPNQLYAVTLGLADAAQAKSVVARVYEHLVVPAGLRSVANRPLSRWPWPEGASTPPGMDPMRPYRGRYEGDEDRSRKLAYHNGTAWAHLLPLWVEALLVAFGEDKRAVRLARAVLRTYEPEMRRACVGQISEIFDGDHPHENRGCCAQAWAVTEFLRVWKRIQHITS